MNECFVSQGIKDTIQERLVISLSFCYKFTGVSLCQKLTKHSLLWQSYCKNKMVQFFTQSVTAVWNNMEAVLFIFYCI